MLLTASIFALAAIGATARPAPQGVTANITPSSSAPSGCMPTYSGTFGIAVMNITSTGSSKPVATQAPDGQPAAGKSAATVATQARDGQPAAGTSAASVVTQKSDGQPNAGTSAAVVTQIGDGQVQAGTMTMHAITQIGDGQIQAPHPTVAAVNQIGDGQPQAPKTTAVAQLPDGQPQASKTTAVAQLSDGQPQASKSASAVSQLNDGQPQAKSTLTTAKAASNAADGQTQATQSASSSSKGIAMTACKTDSTLSLTLKGGKLTDNQGRTGYIAANYQFQFDSPPQAGAIFTGGFSACENNTLALGGSTVFYSCSSGDFSNLYDRHWAPQCVPVEIGIVSLSDC